MTEKEQRIRVEILPRLESVANNLWDDGKGRFGAKVDLIAYLIKEILDSTPDKQ